MLSLHSHALPARWEDGLCQAFAEVRLLDAHRQASLRSEAAGRMPD